MECPKCKKDFAEAVKAAYGLGYQDGEQQLRETIVLIKKTHRHMLDELMRLDKTNPLDGIKIPRKYIKRLINHLESTKKGNYHSKKLRGMLK